MCLSPRGLQVGSQASCQGGFEPGRPSSPTPARVGTPITAGRAGTLPARCAPPSWGGLYASDRAARAAPIDSDSSPIDDRIHAAAINPNQIQVAWGNGSPASSHFNVYHAIGTCGSHRVAAGVIGTSFADSTGVNGNTTYDYMVRAVDAGNGAEDGNTALASAMPTGPTAFSDTFEGSLSGLGFDNAGWTHAALSGGIDWALSTDRSQTPAHSWFSSDQQTTSERVLATPSIPIQAGMTLSFWHTFAFDGDAFLCYDAGTLETSTDGGGTWSVFPAAAFRSGGFNGTVNPDFDNPIRGLPAWCGGTIGAMTKVVADLSSFAGQNLQLRWHEGDDFVASVVGWYVDSVSVAGSCQASPPVPLQFYTMAPCRLIDTRAPPARSAALLCSH